MMHDCSNGLTRDLLPLWVHGALTKSEAGAVAAHVAGCDACASEVRLMQGVAVALQVPAPDAARIAASLPTARHVRARAVRARRWRFAAAASFLMVASVSLIRLRERPSTPAASTASTASEVTTLAVIADPPMPLVVPMENVPVTLDAPEGASLPGFSSVAELSDAQLRVLLNDLETLKALPSAEPEAGPPGLVYATPEGGS